MCYKATQHSPDLGPKQHLISHKHLGLGALDCSLQAEPKRATHIASLGLFVPVAPGTPNQAHPSPAASERAETQL